MCIVNDAWQLAIGGTLLAGFSDWLDGYLAKKKSQESSLGSYLDPLADKVLVTCLTVATGYKGLIDPTVCSIIIGRDVVLLGGAFLHRAHVLNWRWKTWREYFRVVQAKNDGEAPAAPNVKPIFISKLNTVFQIALVVGAISNGGLSWPDAQLVQGLGYLTAATTITSGAIYVRMYFKGQMLR
ncbi:putative phosphatidylglycerophosphate synthase [Chloropicon primus]|uniref:Putative phosphatidylglycerophosphate synthase n=1 Tax=Chloropicon primus TaxID=1764295 RepID=A0A5B8MI84_9CHLO|nr:putative phosphatidylglycerophosphate synthase [Chloropicon primus]UPQ98985.1 putative phosphatidylglycerophosphate synthase [Chloropicon primus]|eukprot:QDZ19774.1 putative phosphatidylglycerophosphate synthase [Chloropicon primus]